MKTEEESNETELVIETSARQAGFLSPPHLFLTCLYSEPEGEDPGADGGGQDAEHDGDQDQGGGEGDGEGAAGGGQDDRGGGGDQEGEDRGMQRGSGDARGSGVCQCYPQHH